MKPRPSTIIRRFLDGWTIGAIVWHFRRSGLYEHDVERAIRNALNHKQARDRRVAKRAPAKEAA